MELNSYIWDNVWTDVCCVLSIDVRIMYGLMFAVY